MRRYLGLLLAGMAWIGAAQAATVNIDFGDSANSGALYVGVGAAPDAGTLWTQTWSSYANLPDSFGNATGVSLTVESGWGETTSTPYYNNLTRDRLYVNGTTTSPEFTLGGLDANKTYNVYLYATKHSTAFKHTATGAERAAIGWTQASGAADFHEADTYAAFRGLTGATSYSFTARGLTSQGWHLPNTGIASVLGGIQIQEVAAPGSLRQYWTFDEGAGYSAANRVAAGHTALTATYSATDNKPQPATWVTSGLEPKLTSRVTAPSTSAIDIDPANTSYDYINGGHLRLNTSASSGQVTLSMWLNPDSLTQDSRLFGQITQGTGHAGAVAINNNKLQVWSGSAWNDLIPAGGLAINQWQHLALVWDRNQVTAYLDGARQLTATSLFQFDGTPTAVDFGLGAKYRGVHGQSFNGQIDDVAIWSRVLPAANIANLAEGASPLNPVPQRLYQQVVNVDVQGGNSTTINYVGLGAANDRVENTFWNTARSLSSNGYDVNVQNLKASDGTTITPVGATITGNAGVTDSYAHVTGNTLQGDRVYNSGSDTSTFVINGLNPRREYDIYFYGSEHPTSFTIDGVTQSTGVGGAGSPPIWVEGTDYVVFQGIGYTSSITGTYTREGTTNWGALPGFQVAMHLPRQVVNIDLQREGDAVYDGLGAAPDASTHTFWNAMNVSGSSAASATNLLASDGSTATDFTVSVTGHYGTTGNYQNVSGNTLQGDRVWDTTLPNLGGDGIGEFTISGLDPGNSYDVYLYTSEWGAEFTFDGRTLTAIGGNAGGQAGGWNGEAPDWMEGTHYVLFEDVTAAGTLTGTFSVPNGDDYATLSGIQIAVYIPEPGSALLLAMAVMGLAFWRRRGRR